MSLVTENFQSKRLKNLNINIKTKYSVLGKILERNTDNSKNDDIKNGVILKKQYYKDGMLIHTAYNFDPRIEYTYISQDEENKKINCPNCGKDGLVKDFIDGCPYCHTHCNIDYTDKELGKKEHFDQIIHNEKYSKITLLIDIIISAIILFSYIYLNSRTFNIYDIFKIIVGTLILGFSLYYVFYMLDALIVLFPIKIYKNKMNQKQKEFWNRMNKINVDKKIFFNNFNYELKEYYYSNRFPNIIDYDIIDYLEFNEFKDKNDTLNINVTLNIRIIEYTNKIKVSIRKEKFTFIRSNIESDKLNNGINIIKCPGCGASIDVTKENCEYCKTKINYLQEWYLKD